MRARQLRRGLLIGGLLLVAAWLATNILGLAGKAHIAVSQAGDARWRYEELESRKATLEANLAALATVRGKDAAIRSAFGVARPGEEVIVVVPPASSTATTTNPWWRKMFEWLF